MLYMLRIVCRRRYTDTHFDRLKTSVTMANVILVEDVVQQEQQLQMKSSQFKLRLRKVYSMWMLYLLIEEMP